MVFVVHLKFFSSITIRENHGMCLLGIAKIQMSGNLLATFIANNKIHDIKMNHSQVRDQNQSHHQSKEYEEVDTVSPENEECSFL